MLVNLLVFLSLLTRLIVRPLGINCTAVPEMVIIRLVARLIFVAFLRVTVLRLFPLLLWLVLPELVYISSLFMLMTVRPLIPLCSMARIKRLRAPRPRSVVITRGGKRF